MHDLEKKLFQLEELLFLSLQTSQQQTAEIFILWNPIL